MLHPTKYAEVFAKKIEEHNSTCYLVNTGWIGGGYNTGGKRISIKDTRAIISAILNGELVNCETELVKPFMLSIPKNINGLDNNILNPENSWQDKAAFKETAHKLAGFFINNFEKFTDTEEGKRLREFGPKL
jgi:phosphoenolpyruvate carboxykinase (ATP)